MIARALATLFFALASLGGAAVLAGILWMLFARSLWGHPVGPPPGAPPEEVRAWRERTSPGVEEPFVLNWVEVKTAVRAGHWRDVWPILFVLGGATAVLIFLPLGILTGTREVWTGAGGLVLGLIILWRGYAALTRETH